MWQGKLARMLGARAADSENTGTRLVAGLLAAVARNRWCGRRCAAACRSSGGRRAACSSRRRAARRIEGGSPARPPGWFSRPTWIVPPRKVPDGQHHGAGAEFDAALRDARRRRVRPRSAGRRPPAGTAADSAEFSSRRRIARLYSCRSACARVARTAGPLLAFSVRNWMPACVGRAAPSRRRARRSLSPDDPCRCRRSPDCSSSAPSVSMLCVSSSVRAPMRAAASAASVPAWPPPITMTSNPRSKRIILNPEAFSGSRVL